MSKSPDDENVETAKAIMAKLVATPHKPHVTKKPAKKKPTKRQAKSSSA